MYNGSVAKEILLFELNDTVLERIIFAMEDQSRSRYIDLRSGELVPKPEGSIPEWIAPPPAWSPADGFQLMEGFCARIGRLEPKLALNRALARGRGVFKSFRQILAEYPKEEALFREYKNAALRHRVELWMDDMREALGLARLGAEPEEFQDLVDEAFSLESGFLADAPFSLGEMIARALEEALNWLPALAVSLEKTELFDFLTAQGQKGWLHYANEADGRAVALAAMGFVDTAAGAVGLIRFLYVVPEFRGLGLELRLIESLVSRCRSEGLATCFLRCGLLAPSLVASLESSGLKFSGAQYLIE